MAGARKSPSSDYLTSHQKPDDLPDEHDFLKHLTKNGRNLKLCIKLSTDSWQPFNYQ